MRSKWLDWQPDPVRVIGKSVPSEPPKLTKASSVGFVSPSLATFPITKGCPRLPRGVRLIHYEPKEAPVALETASVVTDVPLFIRRELEELNARLHSPVQICGGWGVFTILDRLRQAGVELALEPTANPVAAEKLSPDDFGTLTGSGDPR